MGYYPRICQNPCVRIQRSVCRLYSRFVQIALVLIQVAGRPEWHHQCGNIDSMNLPSVRQPNAKDQRTIPMLILIASDGAILLARHESALARVSSSATESRCILMTQTKCRKGSDRGFLLARRTVTNRGITYLTVWMILGNVDSPTSISCPAVQSSAQSWRSRQNKSVRLHQYYLMHPRQTLVLLLFPG